MITPGLKTPVVFLVFNRPSVTAKVFGAIRHAQPPKLLVVADGPRSDRTEEQLCEETRKFATSVDWPCEVFTRFSTENLGCRLNVSSGLDWAFDQVEEAIILEDDCLPDPSFFPFCQELLERYRDNPAISEISGSNYQQGRRRTDFSYYFSRHAHIWGWATWRRSWRHNDLRMSAWPKLRERGWLHDYLRDSKAAFYWTKLFDDSYRGSHDSLNSWAIPWTFSCWARDSLSIIPETNLVSNIGYSDASTHTTRHSTANLTSRGAISFPLQHPSLVQAQAEADRFTEETFYYGQSLAEQWFWRLRPPVSVATVRRIRRLLRASLGK